MLFTPHRADVVKVEPPQGHWGRAIGKRHEDGSTYGIALGLAPPATVAIEAAAVVRASAHVETGGGQERT